MKTISLRGIDEELAENLKKTAKKKGDSINKTVLEILRHSLGVGSKKRERVYHDLDDLAGTWSKTDWQQFQKTTKPFSAVDKDLWK
ncbi:MAG: antitoxin [Thermodesulfobacteriota bacterium]